MKNSCEIREEAMTTDRRVKKRKIMSEVFTDYCTSTSLHGMGYLGAQDKKVSEKIWWLIVFVLSLTACSYMISKTWIKWETDPVILSFEKEQVPIWEIPFPAVTVCPVNKIRRTRYNYTEKVHKRNNMSEDELKKFWDISLVCNLDQYPNMKFNCTFNTTDEEAMTNIIQNSVRFFNAITEPKWQNKNLLTTRLFRSRMTEEGVCFTFNDLSPKDIFKTGVYISEGIDTAYSYNINSSWTLEKGYLNEINKSDYPRRTTKDGITSGLSFKLVSLQDDIDYVCGVPITGYKTIGIWCININGYNQKLKQVRVSPDALTMEGDINVINISPQVVTIFGMFGACRRE